MKCIDALGFRAGLGTAVDFFLHRKNPSKQLDIRVPGLKAPLTLLGGSSHLPTFMQIFVNFHYDIDKFPQAKTLKAWFRDARGAGKNPPIIDCGANIGLSSVWFASQFPEATVYAVEPSPSNFELLKRNAAPYPNIIPLLGGVWDRNTELSIVNPEGSSWQFRVGETSATEAENLVRAFTIPQILELAGAEEALMVKLDIEGSEAALFRSNTAWLDRTALLIIELHDWIMPWQDTSRTFIAATSQRSFDYAVSGENLYLFHHKLRSAEDVRKRVEAAA